MNEEYTFGRGEECDYCFENHSHGKKLPQYLALSKTHFRVYRVCDQGVVTTMCPVLQPAMAIKKFDHQNEGLIV